MSVKKELETLKNSDIYSILMFALYKLNNSDEFSALSELSFVLDEKNLLNLCEYFGGLTIRIPTIEELELLLCGLNVYKLVVLDGEDYDSVIENYPTKFSTLSVKKSYNLISSVLSDYTFGGEER